MSIPKSTVYLHGYSSKEQQRLYHQADFLKDFIYEGVDFTNNKKLLEVGCGVGAQTKILIEKFPHLKIDGIDISPVQLATAAQHLQNEVANGQVDLRLANAEKMSGLPTDYDSAFLCWFLEHVPKPLKVLKETHQRLKPGAKIYCSEVQNASFFVDPYSPMILKYWFEFNDFQWMSQGHPFIGAQLGNLLLEAGFHDIKLEARPFFFDSSRPEKRKEFIAYFCELLLSAGPALLKDKRISVRDLAKVKAEMKKLARTKNSVLFYTWIRATARA
jgi:ubiquinone/menaquinone biosynthesis C-methylase UbiE